MSVLKYQGVAPILDMLEERLDLAHTAEVEQLHLDAMHFKPIPRMPLSVEYPADQRFEHLPYKEVFNDPEKMLYNELVSIDNNVWNSIRLGDDYPLQVRPNYGVGLISSLFGSEIKVLDRAMPWVKPVEDMDDFRDMIANGIPDVKGGLAGRVAEAYDCYRELLKPYPKCSQAIHVTQPDMQGPFDNFHLMHGNEVFFELYEEPEFVHEAMDVITQTMIAYQKTLPALNDAASSDSRYIHRAIYSGDTLLKLDTEAAMISGEMYQEFCAPYNQRFYQAFGGGGSLHFCGGGATWPAVQMPELDIRCLNFGNPEKQDVLTSWKPALDRGICVVGYGECQPYSFLQEKMRNGLRTGVTFLTRVESFEEAQAVWQTHLSTNYWGNCGDRE